MSLFKKLFSGTQNDMPVSMETLPGKVYAPAAGTVITLSEIGDGVFSEGVLGRGCGIRPSEETIYAPFDGTVAQIAETRHAIGLVSSDGIELLIHVGMDTVSMNGKGFQVHVSCGDQVKCGQKLLTFSKKEIAAAGYPDVTAVIITNSDEFPNIQFCPAGPIQPFEELMTVK